MTALLDVRGLCVRYGAAVAVDDVSLELREGERTALIGPNGAGKTSLLHAILGLVRPYRGSVSVAGSDMTGAPPLRMVKQGVALVPEGRQVFASLSVETNLVLGAYGRMFRREMVSGTLAFLAHRSEVTARLEGVYDLMPRLRALRSRPAGRTSGGEQQMVAIGRALMADPRILLIDELSLGLAPVVVQALAEFLRELNEEAGVAILLVEQNAHLALDLCARAYVLDGGRCAIAGASSDLRDEPAIRNAYLGGSVEARA